jgi:hypothetical protein
MAAKEGLLATHELATDVTHSDAPDVYKYHHIMVTSSHPESVDDYVSWASTTLGIDFAAPATRNRYETNLQNAQTALEDSRFMMEFQAFLAQQEEEYKRKMGAGLLMSSELIPVRKPFRSAVTKSYRANVLSNRNFPNPPKRGWTNPDNWYERFDDLIRSVLVCKFLDGPKVLALALDEFVDVVGLTCRHVPRSTDDGYYAFHHYTGIPVHIVDAAWQTHETTVQFEIQLTTQLQEVLRQLTHPLYEQARVAKDRKDDSWKWEYDAPRFRTSYLGHTLHMIEAVIVQVRDSLRNSPAGPRDSGASAQEGAPEDSSGENEG